MKHLWQGALLAGGLALGLSACSSGDSEPTESTSPSTTTASPATSSAAPTSPTSSPTISPAADCSDDALSKPIGGGELPVSISLKTCQDGYAGVEASVDGGKAQGFILQANGAEWNDVTSETCGAASAGIPPDVLQYCPKA